MSENRIALLRKAYKRVRYSREWHREPELIEVIRAIARSNPGDQKSPHGRLETYLAMTYAREILEGSVQMAYANGWLEDLHELTQDPTIFSQWMSSALGVGPKQSGFEATRELLEVIISLGGIISEKDFGAMEALFSPGNAGCQHLHPSILKRLLCNQVDLDWALDPSASEFKSYALYVRNLTAFIGEKDPSWTVSFLLSNGDKLLKILGHCSYLDLSDDLMVIAECLQASVTSAMLIELDSQCPDLYDRFLSKPATLDLLVSTVALKPRFEVSSLPVHKSISRDLIAKMFDRSSIRDKLDRKRLADLRAAWRKAGETGSLVNYAVSGSADSQLAKAARAYYLMTCGKNCEPKLILGAKGKFHHVGKNFDFLDDLMAREAGTLSVRDSAGHKAYLLVSEMIPSDEISSLPRESCVMGVALRILASSKRKDELEAFIRACFTEDTSRSQVRQLTKDEIDIAMSLRPTVLDADELHRIDWADRAIKAALIEEGLGI